MTQRWMWAPNCQQKGRFGGQTPSENGQLQKLQPNHQSYAATWPIQMRSCLDLPQWFHFLSNYFGACYYCYYHHHHESGVYLVWRSVVHGIVCLGMSSYGVTWSTMTGPSVHQSLGLHAAVRGVRSTSVCMTAVLSSRVKSCIATSTKSYMSASLMMHSCLLPHPRTASSRYDIILGAHKVQIFQACKLMASVIDARKLWKITQVVATF